MLQALTKQIQHTDSISRFKKHEQKQSNYFKIQAQDQWKHFAEFIEINKTKIADKININVQIAF